jgi:uncharacterized protein
MSQTDLDLTVVDNPDAKRFEARAGDDLLGVIEYIPLPGKVIATHTEVFEQYEGKGVGSRLVAGALDLLRADDRVVQPQCAYVRHFLAEHDEYADVVDPDSPY